MWYHHPEQFLDNLDGINILVTRAVEQASVFTDLLRDLGANVQEIPVLEITEPSDYDDLDRCLQEIDRYDWIVFASTNAVAYTLARAQKLGLNITSDRTKLAAVGPSTAAALVEHNLKVDFCPSAFIAEALIEEFPGYPDLQGKKILWPKTNIGRRLIIDQFVAAGASVETAVVYITALPDGHRQLASELVKTLADRRIDVITLASAQSARNLAQLINEGLEENAEHGESQSGALTTMQSLLLGVQIAAIGPVTARAAREKLGHVDIEASDHTIIGLIKSLLASLKFPQKET